MGEVWAAQHISLEIPCAVKFIHGESASQPEVRMRFQREAKAAAQLRSPNVVQILDHGVYENVPYIAMEYLDGEPLNARLKRRVRLDAFETFRIISGVGKGLGRAHAAGIVHRDLKPENIFLVHDEDGETPKVLDFGVAKSTTTLDSNTRTGALLGTPYYMSPEQAQGTKAVDHRADLWSLAVVTFRCLTGELPFKSTALGDLLIKIVTHALPVPSHLAPGLPEGFDAWWERAAQREPDRRFQSAKEFVEALGLALGVSVPSNLGQTPMPGKMPATTAAFPATTFAQSNAPITSPLPFDQLAFNPAGPQPTMGFPQPAHTQAMAPGAVPVFGSGAHPLPHLSESGSAGSVAGITAAPMRQGNGKMLAVVGVSVAALAIAGVVGAVVAFGPSESAPAAETTAPTVSEAPSEAEEPPPPPPPPTQPEPVPSASTNTPPPPAPDRPRPQPRPAPPPEPAAPPPPVDVPKPPPPAPTPKPKGFDPGF